MIVCMRAALAITSSKIDIVSVRAYRSNPWPAELRYVHGPKRRGGL